MPMMKHVVHQHLPTLLHSSLLDDSFMRPVQDEKHLSRITPQLKARYKLHPSGQPEHMSTGVNMSLLAYAGPYKAIGQSIR